MKFATPTGTDNACSNASRNRRGNEAVKCVYCRSLRFLAPATAPKKNRRASAFTLVEVLAAMMFMAIVIPVTIEALHVSSLSGEFATRKAVAARIADRVLNENLTATTGNLLSGLNGTVTENGLEFRWTVNSQSWSQDATMQLVTAEVTFSAGGRNYSVRLNTIANPQAATTQPATTSGGTR